MNDPSVPDWLALARRFQEATAAMLHRENVDLNGDAFHAEALRRTFDGESMVPASRDVVPRAEHEAAVRRELEWQHHWFEEAQRWELEAGRLRRLLDLADVERIGNVSRLVRSLARSRTAKHDDQCWQRHPGCLAGRVSDLLEGRGEPAPTGGTA